MLNDDYKKNFHAIESPWVDSFELGRLGTKFYKPIPHVAPMARLHKLFPPLNDYQIKDLEIKLKNIIPRDLSELYLIHNGFSLFSNYFVLYGLRNSELKGAERVMEQPFDILTPNLYERPAALRGLVICGRIGNKMNLITIDANSRVYLIAKDGSGDILNEWKSLPLLISDCVSELSACFDSDGVKIKDSCRF